MSRKAIQVAVLEKDGLIGFFALASDGSMWMRHIADVSGCPEKWILIEDLHNCSRRISADRRAVTTEASSIDE